MSIAVTSAVSQGTTIMAVTVRSSGQQCSLRRREADIAEQIRQALKAVNLMKMLEGKQAIGNQSNNKIIGEHKVRFLSFLLDSFPPSDISSAISRGRPHPADRSR